MRNISLADRIVRRLGRPLTTEEAEIVLLTESLLEEEQGTFYIAKGSTCYPRPS